MNDTPLVITQFLSYKEVIQNRSSLTVIEYQRDLTMFFSYLLKSRGMDENSLSLVDGGFINSVTPEDIYSFLLYLSRQRKVSGSGASKSRLPTRARSSRSTGTSARSGQVRA